MLIEDISLNTPLEIARRHSKTERPTVRGKFLYAGDEKLWVRGVTYGTFRPNADGHEFPSVDVIDRDFGDMAANGVNAVRTYTVPPRELLDAAHRHDLRVMVGLAAERLIGYFVEQGSIRRIDDSVRAGVRACGAHPSLLCYTVANEIPAHLARWMGRKRTESFLERLCSIVKDEDPAGLVTYVNYPSTEYLELSFLDFVSFNVYLESRDHFDRYLARLQNLAGDRPLVMSELGLDSLRNGEQGQARTLDWQLRSTFSAGCAGAFVFSWTDEWHAGGVDMEDWAFGLTRRNRQPKRALEAMRSAFSEVPFRASARWPRVSVVICSYNGARTIRETLERVLRLDYPDFEVIVVDDGSTDDTASIAREFGCTVISTPNRGLSSARNAGLEAATGEIAAYMDDDAHPDPDWLSYLAATFTSTDFVCVGGPNIPPAGDGAIADCVARAPGGPVHVLLSDREAEHVPGCNMAFRTSALRAIGGFDPQFRVAGDDVDVCWRLQERGWRLGFNPAAVVWHHRRNSIAAYWRQQRGYGRAEAMLERKWPEKYNSAGHVMWTGRIYGNSWTDVLTWTSRIYHGVWGSAPFQRMYQPPASVARSLPLMPEWYLLILALAILSVLGIFWTPLLVFVPLAISATAASLALACIAGARATFPERTLSGLDRLKRRSLIVLLHLVQPIARLTGRLRSGLTPWRWRGAGDIVRPLSREFRIWCSGRWQAQEERLHAIEVEVLKERSRVLRGGAFDRWDLELRGGLFGGARLLMAVEEHGSGTQLIRVRSWARFRPRGVVVISLFGVLAAGAALDRAFPVAAILGLWSAGVGVRMLQDCSAALAGLLGALKQLHPEIE